MSIVDKQSGAAIFGFGDTTINVPISAVSDLSKTFLKINIRGNGDSSGDMAYIGVGAILTSTNNLRLKRTFGNTVKLIVEWTITETSDWIVQRGTVDLSVTSLLHPIVSVDETIAFSVGFGYGQSMPTMLEDALVSDIITDPTTLKFTSSFASVANHVDYQVVEIPGSSVQKGEFSAINTAFDDIVLSSVITAETFVEFNCHKTTASVTPEQIRGGRIVDSTTLRFSGYLIGSLGFAWYTISHPDFNVQRGWYVGTTTNELITIATVDTSKTLVDLKGQYNSWQTTDRAVIDIRDFSWTSELNSPTQIQLQRDNDLVSNSTISWETLEISGGVIPSVVPQITDYYRRQNSC